MTPAAPPAASAGAVADGRRVRWRAHNQGRRLAIVMAAVDVIERQAPGEELQLQAVAEAAGVSRTVIYRHFGDRADLDRAVQQHICEEIATRLVPGLAPDGTPEEIIHRLIDAFVTWAVEHPTLYRFVDRDPAGWGASPLGEAIAQLAASIESLMTGVLRAIGVQLEDDDRAVMDPWIFGLLGAVFAAVRRWLEREVREPSAQVLASVLAASTWSQVDGMARRRGLDLPRLPLTEVLVALGTPAPEALDLEETA
ncbi:TetR/AcrR family transcriptional regulator [Nocardioides sp.]|uniref:TetR/AcrR family transcriptional regulator n=1 Tax=Nocardioides sp. TaxID=35761 RepID=UPI003510DE79